MGKFLKKYGDYVFPVSMFLFFTILFIFYCKMLEKCTEWDSIAFKSLVGCINCGWITIVWLLDIKQITDNKHFNEIKKLFGKKEEEDDL